MRHTQLYSRWSAPGVPGDCWATGVECLLGMPRGSLPRGRTREDWLAGCHAAMDVLHEAGIKRFCHHDAPPDGPHLECGATDRGSEMHAVVVFADGSRWDPHPSRSGLTEVRWWETLAESSRSV